ncbi:unnamed protein product [Amoebophrya sp. A25]|nr:unnamed protein product [Amoebophrya sp. A25]|eukprot:GSA25T00017684001.1
MKEDADAPTTRHLKPDEVEAVPWTNDEPCCEDIASRLLETGTPLEKRLAEAWRQKCPDIRTVEDIPHRMRQCGSKHVLHFSPGRAAKRVMGKPITDAFVPRAPNGFDFSKVGSSEVLLAGREVFEEVVKAGEDDNYDITEDTKNPTGVRVLLNLHPIAPLHVLLLPPGLEEQFLSESGIRVGLRFASRCKSMRLTFNGMGAGASVNHLHWQATVFPESVGIDSCQRVLWRSRKVLGNRNSPTTSCPSSRREISDSGGAVVSIYRIPDWPLKSMCEVRWEQEEPVDAFEEGNGGSGQEHLLIIEDALTATLLPMVQRMQKENVTHNLSIYPGGRRITVAARHFFCPQSENPSAMAGAALETLGHWIIPSLEDYESSTEESLGALWSSLSIPEEERIERFFLGEDG